MKIILPAELKRKNIFFSIAEKKIKQNGKRRLGDSRTSTRRVYNNYRNAIHRNNLGESYK